GSLPDQTLKARVKLALDVAEAFCRGKPEVAAVSAIYAMRGRHELPRHVRRSRACPSWPRASLPGTAPVGSRNVPEFSVRTCPNKDSTRRKYRHERRGRRRVGRKLCDEVAPPRGASNARVQPTHVPERRTDALTKSTRMLWSRGVLRVVWT